jgi:uncharacterized transporter YbjL
MEVLRNSRGAHFALVMGLRTGVVIVTLVLGFCHTSARICGTVCYN